MTRAAGMNSSLATASQSDGGGAVGRLVKRLWPSAALRQVVIERVRRRGVRPPPYALAYRNIFILPTLFGSSFAFLLILMTLGGLNFNNNLALLLVFMLAALAQMTTHLAYRNLSNLEIMAVRGEPAFAGDPVHLQLALHNPEDRHRFALEGALATDPVGDCVDAGPGGGTSLSLRLNTKDRGWLEVPPLRLQTVYPLGLFRAWTWVFPGTRCIVYPQPAQNPPPLPATGDGRSGKSRRGEGDQVYGLRSYRPGDPLKRIAWRTSARHDHLYTREMERPQQSSCVLDFQRLEGLDVERRLSVLTAWVLMADHRQLPYSLELPGQRIATASGTAHRNDCLEALALFDR